MFTSTNLVMNKRSAHLMERLSIMASAILSGMEILNMQ